jgi:hypothetical protein
MFKLAMILAKKLIARRKGEYMIIDYGMFILGVIAFPFSC